MLRRVEGLWSWAIHIKAQTLLKYCSRMQHRKIEDAKAEDAVAEVITHIAPDFYASQHLTEGIGTECNSG